MVASRRDAQRRAARLGVSIPFIAGQWSLLGADIAEASCCAPSQSPSLRGSGRFERRAAKAGADLAESSQSPSLRGSGRFKRLRHILEADPDLSQSPSLRGSGRFSTQASASLTPLRGFQSPSLRGSGRFAVFVAVLAAAAVSQSPSLRGSGRF